MSEASKALHSLQCGRFQLDLSRPLIMGILNLTPDSFSDGGSYLEPSRALEQAQRMLDEGADLIDIGAESTRPGSRAVSAEEELQRLETVTRRLLEEDRVPISIDTKKTAVMQRVLEWGVDLINDVHALEDEGAIEAVAASRCAICLMHMRGMPENMQEHTEYQDVVSEVATYLRTRAEACEAAGIAPNRLIMDPGFGFGKTPAQNLALLKHCGDFGLHRYAVLMGNSRKSTLGALTGIREARERVTISAIAAFVGMQAGAQIVRVHDVAETVQARALFEALQNV